MDDRESLNSLFDRSLFDRLNETIIYSDRHDMITPPVGKVATLESQSDT